MSDRVILSFDEFSMLHRITMAWPDGLRIPSIDPVVQQLAAMGYVRLTGAIWLPTEAGVSHIMPKNSSRAA